MPAEDFVGAFGIGPDLDDVTGAARSNLVGHLHARGLLECGDDVPDAVADARAEVYGLAARIFP